MHHGCRCHQTAIKPGDQAPQPFVDYRKLIDDLPAAERVKVVGASSLRLIEQGVVPWDEVVTSGRIRTLREVVSRRKLTVDQMVRSGVRRSIAEQAYQSVHTPEHELAEAQRREAMGRLVAAGVPQQALLDELSGRLASRVALAPGPAGEWAGGPLPGTGPSTAAELAALLKAARPPRRKPPGGAAPTPRA